MENENKTPASESKKTEPKKPLGDSMKDFFAKLMPKKEEKVGEEKKDGNALTEIMEQSKKKQSLVSNIIKNVKPKPEETQTEVNKVMLRSNETQLFWGRVTSAGVLVFLLVSLAVNWVWLNPANPVLGMVGKENIVQAEKRTDKQLEKVTKNYNDLNEENKALISQDSSGEAVVSKEIMANRITWTEVIDQIDEVVHKVSPYNPVTKKIDISQYSLDANSGKLVISGLIQNESEDKIYNLTANVVDALEESPYFEDVDYRQYTIAEEELGSFTSPLRVTFYIQDEESSESDSMNYASTDYSKRRYRHDGFQFSTEIDDEVNNDEE